VAVLHARIHSVVPHGLSSSSSQPVSKAHAPVQTGPSFLSLQVYGEKFGLGTRKSRWAPTRVDIEPEWQAFAELWTDEPWWRVDDVD
jgi:hypothetical protein